MSAGVGQKPMARSCMLHTFWCGCQKLVGATSTAYLVQYPVSPQNSMQMPACSNMQRQALLYLPMSP